MRADAEAVAAMRARLAQRQEERRFDMDAAQAIDLVHHRQPMVAPERATAAE